MENKTPMQKAFADYLSNKYYLFQLLALFMLSAFFYYAEEFENNLDIILILTPILSGLLTPFFFIFIWAYRYKKGTRK